MINDIAAFDVGCGDCSILYNKKSCLLVDYGGDKIKKQNCLNSIVNLLSNFQEKSLMISHLHSDHYDGIPLLANQVTFDNIYMPDYISGFGIYILASALFLKNNRIITLAKQILSLPKLFFKNGLIHKNTNIYFLVSGDLIKNNLDNFEVLLPKKYNCKLSSELMRKIINNNPINKIVEFYKNHLKNITENIDEYLNAINDKIENIYFEIDMLIEKEEQIFNFQEEIMIKKEFERYHNNMSIVFQNKIFREKNILFCGDALANDIRKIQGKLHQIYEVIKIPHHDTYNKYFFENYPPTQKFLIFNDKGTNCHRISCSYDNYYGNKTTLLCSNPNCQKVIHHCACFSQLNKHASCGFGGNYKIINL